MKKPVRGSQKAVQERRAKQAGARRLAQKEHQYNAWQHLTRNQQEVARRILQGDYEMIGGAGWGLLDRFFIFVGELGFFEVLDVDGAGYQRKMLTVALLLLTYSMKVLVGIGSMNAVPDLLFRDIGLLMMIGFTARQIEEGVCRRGEVEGEERRRPIHESTLAECLNRLSVREALYVHREAANSASSRCGSWCTGGSSARVRDGLPWMRRTWRRQRSSRGAAASRSWRRKDAGAVAW